MKNKIKGILYTILLIILPSNALNSCARAITRQEMTCLVIYIERTIK
ncbi:hypothetical protein N752_24465 [Desulforamulus aquiferis]|nr:hypothetical protein N752_24465 [Desulforamulus aquiferis]